MTTTIAIHTPLSLNHNPLSPAQDSNKPAANFVSSTPHASLSSTTQARLLYRGALSLPDSNLLLDGLTFTISLPSDDPHASRTLLESPLPLALESMRGRPSLRFGGVVKMEHVNCDFNERVSLHVHPKCILTCQLFAHTLCVAPVSPSQGHTDSGIRISLGDASGASNSTTVNSANNDIVVFGRPHASSSTMQLCVARILPTPPQLKSALPSHMAAEKAQQARPPRPDDPIPRKPPAGFTGIGVGRTGLGMNRTLSMKMKGGGAFEEEDGAGKKRAKKDSETNGARGGQGSFKIPSLPPGKARSATEADAFDVQMQLGEDGTGVSRTSDIETENKMFIKKAVVRLMSAQGIGRANPSFKDFFNAVYHGTSFALRGKINTSNFESDPKEGALVDRIAQAHITLYLGGQGVGVLLLQ